MNYSVKAKAWNGSKIVTTYYTVDSKNAIEAAERARIILISQYGHDEHGRPNGWTEDAGPLDWRLSHQCDITHIEIP